jgi:hypothetical protein
MSVSSYYTIINKPLWVSSAFPKADDGIIIQMITDKLLK